MSTPILVGFDPRAGDRAPVEFAVALARLTEASVVVGCVQRGTQAIGISVQQSLPYAIVDPDLGDDCTAALEQFEPELRATGVAVESRPLPSTSAARALHEEAERENAELIVVGAGRGSGDGGVAEGSTAARLLRGAPCPVAVVPRAWTAERGFATVGVAFVDTEEGREALDAARAIARRVGAALRVLTVLEDGDAAHAERELRSRASLDGDLRVEVEVLNGERAPALTEASERVDLLVCGSRGYGPLRAVLLGSVSRRVVAGAKCPVIVVPRGVGDSFQALLKRSATTAARATAAGRQ
jgi:nucleotide-binding universal stress UspA family protein